MKLFVTILEETPERAIEAIRSIDADHDGVEIRAERFTKYDIRALRATTTKPIIFTRRGLPFDENVMREAIEAGIDFVDVEYEGPLRAAALHQRCVVLSHHDLNGMPDVETLVRQMSALGPAHVKIAVTPRNFADNERLLRLLTATTNHQPLTTIGLGERGLYSRILAPFRGSELVFVSRSDDRSAAPGQLSLHRALEIYGERRDSLRADRVFAVVGNPAGHSLSPSIHNELFRRKGVAAAYTIASIESFDEIVAPFLNGEPYGLSVTVPFKRDAYNFAQQRGAATGENARECESVNTLVNGKPIVADNTDVDGFESILSQICGRDRKSVAIVGAGGTARAALVAVRRAKMHVTVFNRTEEKGSELAARFGARAEPLDALERFDGEVIINTTTTDAEIPLLSRPGLTYVESAYGSPAVARRQATLRENGVQVFDGWDLLQAQAVRQHELFMRALE
ncbi:MAG TPA: type I 3-dehydroquinate dehydratase [Thermoanaerobaculia bacterium]|jgi:shikimate dehydrogenase/3-dehydroquinate dehydratase type I|nr:type I 3-dehydroquinate dehydratase [Thermoanaerobaculia bacterium]